MIIAKTIFLTLFTIFCYETQVETDVFGNIKTKSSLLKFDYVILQFSTEWDWILKEVQPSELNELEIEEIEEIEKLLHMVIKENNEQEKKELDKHNEKYPKNKWKETGFELKTKGYKRQYVPVINKNGEKVVWVNFFCADNDYWKMDIVWVMDGGNCYFSIKINLSNQSHSELQINGYA